MTDRTRTKGRIVVCGGGGAFLLGFALYSFWIGMAAMFFYMGLAFMIAVGKDEERFEKKND